jgi:type IV pilus assembly protein PilC
MEYRYNACTDQGRAVTGVLQAESESAAEQMLWDAGLTIVSLRRSLSLPKAHEILPSVFGVRKKDVIGFSRNLASLLDAGIPLMRALSILSRHGKEAFRDVLRSLIRDLEEGSKFSDALGKYPAVFPSFYIFLMRTGEETGNLGAVLKDTAAHMEKDEATRAKVKKSLAYPMFVVVLAIAAVIVMLSFVVPKLTGMFTEFGREMPATTRALVALGDFFSANAVFIIGGLLVLVFGSLAYAKTARGRRAKDRLVIRMPVLGPAVLKAGLARFGRNMSMLVGAGVSLFEALELTTETNDNSVIAESLNGVRSRVGEGQLFSEAMAADPMFPPLMAELVGIGEETGNLESQLSKVSAFYEEEAEAAIARVTGMLTPALTVGVGLMIGFIAITMFSSIYGMASIVE